VVEQLDGCLCECQIALILLLCPRPDEALLSATLMGLLTDFFIATPAEIDGLDLSQSPVGKFAGYQAKRIDPVKIEQLQCCIDADKFEEWQSSFEEKPVRDAGEDGPWVLRVPQVLCDALASAGPADIQSYGKAWAETEEWTLDGGEEEEIVLVLGKIAQLASQAKTEGKQLFLWMSL
jgi:hypothetical protein